MSFGIPGIPMLPPGGPGISAVPMELPKDVVRVGEQSLWSAAQLAAGAVANTTTRLFTTPIGQVGQGFVGALTLSETNLKEGSRIPAGLAYDCFGMAFYWQPTGANFMNFLDAQNIYSNGVISWDFLQTVIDVAPVSLIGAGGGLYGLSVDQAGGATQSAVNNSSGGLWVYRRHPVSLPANSTFNVLLRFGGLAQAMNVATVVKVCLIGAYRQAVEIA
ncbi:hypothetical protein CMI37_07450 [Candidatus Pacearchaeota archaeon]|jgi:hypothetical protein|nr:hypothetical protein [Candidatus Pacearchaeota archaeon]